MEISDLKSKILPILKNSGVQRASVFGSTLKKITKPNDIDLLIELDNRVSLLGFINLKQSLEEATGQKVDLVEYSTIKPSLQKSILQNQIELMK